MEAPKRATKFAANDEWGKVYRRVFNQAQMNQPLSILTGATAGATEAVVVVPFELVKIRMQDKASKYTSALDCVAKTVRKEGVLSLYQGLESTMWRHILWNAGYFGCIFQVRQLLPKAENKKAQVTNDLVSGAIGGTVGTILNTPMDVVKSRIQNTPKVAGQVPKYNWAWPSVFTVAREEGFSALYKGFVPKVRSHKIPGTEMEADCCIGAASWPRRRYPPCCLHRCHGYVPQDAGVETRAVREIGGWETQKRTDLDEILRKNLACEIHRNRPSSSEDMWSFRTAFSIFLFNTNLLALPLISSPSRRLGKLTILKSFEQMAIMI